MDVIISVVGLLLICGAQFTKGWLKLCLAIVGSVGVIVGVCLIGGEVGPGLTVGLFLAGIVCCAMGIIKKKIHGKIVQEIHDVILFVIGIVEIILAVVTAIILAACS